MRCEEVRERLLEGAAGGRLSPQIKLHLRECQACSHFCQGYEGLLGVLEAEKLPSLEAVRSTQYLVSLRQRIDNSQRGWVFGLPKPGLVMTLSSTLAVILLLVGIWSFPSRFPVVSYYSPSATLEFALEPSSTYLGAEQELAYLLSGAEIQQERYFSQLLSTSEITSLLQAGELLYPEPDLESLLEDLSEEELQILGRSIRNLISVLPAGTEGVKRC